MWRKQTLMHCWWEYRFRTATMENSMEVPQKLIIELPHDPAIPVLGTSLKDMKTLP